MSRHRFNRYKLRKWAVKVKWRDRRCQVCGSRERLQAHHIFDKTYHPKLAYDLANGIALCGSNKKTGNSCHSTFHNQYMGGTRRKCTQRDWIKFVRLVNWSKNQIEPITDDA